MIARNFVRVSLLLSVVYCAACSGSQPCNNASALLRFTSFPDTETNSIVIRAYKKDGIFDSLADSTLITINNSTYIKSGDTLQVVHNAAEGAGEYILDINFDYQVYFPVNGRTDRITNLIQQQTEKKTGISLDKTACFNPLASYTLNGQTVNITNSGNFIYISK